MGIFNLFDPILNLAFGPLLLLPPIFAIIIITLVISLVITFTYKFMTNQDLMKQLKDELKEFQKQIKELKKEPEKAMKVQKQMMETNMKYMTQSMKPTLITFIPIIVIFGWLSANLAYLPIVPGDEFSVDLQFKRDIEGDVSVEVSDGIRVVSEPMQNIIEGKARFGFTGQGEGEYLLNFNLNNQRYGKRVIITEGKKYFHPIKRKKTFIDNVYSQNDGYLENGQISQIKTSNKGLKPLGKLSILGWNPGWLGTYIIFSIIFSMGLRKLLKIY